MKYYLFSPIIPQFRSTIQAGIRRKKRQSRRGAKIGLERGGGWHKTYKINKSSFSKSYHRAIMIALMCVALRKNLTKSCD